MQLIDYSTGLCLPSGAIIEATYFLRFVDFMEGESDFILLEQEKVYTGCRIVYPCGTKRFISNSWYNDIHPTQTGTRFKKYE